MPVHLQASHASPFERAIHSCWLVKTVKQVSAASRTDSMFSPVRCVPEHRQFGFVCVSKREICKVAFQICVHKYLEQLCWPRYELRSIFYRNSILITALGDSLSLCLFLLHYFLFVPFHVIFLIWIFLLEDSIRLLLDYCYDAEFISRCQRMRI
ncbi:hypothetical protein I7I50_04977 [Histoplasma capsulatum G186AR]|uniref:Transmembrane protein n=1 Tax=Ajellomyces capsulatus TaxID=5037 RepID=A0A8H7Z8N6_AJECA|nr:hypothetical protein I7I52_03235 [Histoplasma capsulatum]QSS75735.1 hypothetical protein I7I50_04977 [Histoplasma capsulatum G186AR]